MSRIYGVYDKETGNTLFVGNVHECVKFCGYKNVGIFYSLFSKKIGKYEIHHVGDENHKGEWRDKDESDI